MEDQKLSAQEIYEAIMEGKIIYYTLGDPSSKEYIKLLEEFNKLINHLHVIKSRKKKLYEDLDLMNKPQNRLIKIEYMKKNGLDMAIISTSLPENTEKKYSIRIFNN